MTIYKITPFSIPKITLFDSVSVDNCIHFKRITEEYIAFFIIRGDMYLMEGDIPYHLKEGDWILLQPGLEHHGYKYSEHCSYYYIHFQTSKIQCLNIEEQELQGILRQQKNDIIHGTKEDDAIYIPKWYHSKENHSSDSLLHLLNQGKHHYNSFKTFYDYQAACVFLDFIIHLSHLFAYEMLENQQTTVKRSTLIVYRLIDDINRNYMQKYSSQMIENKYNCNFDYINRKFKAETGQTIFSYLSDVRISWAKMLLTSGNIPIKEIAIRIGFEDIYYFSNFFKKQTGYSPTQYQRLVLGNG